jgi:anti-sigma factor RsiW
MKTARAPDWQMLNAYVDGELDTAEAAFVAEAAGNDPAIADQIALLYQLKGFSHETFAGQIPDDLSGINLERPFWRRAPIMMAAAMVAATLVAGALFLDPGVGSVEANAMAVAREMHGEWLKNDGVQSEQKSTAILVNALTQFQGMPVIPDLESAQLHISRVKYSSEENGQVLQIGYRGNHGCHVSLFVFSDGHMPTKMAEIERGKEKAYAWEIGDLGYLLFAVGMDPNRLELLARKIELQTRSRQPFDSSTREALADSKRSSASCAA